MKLVSAPSCNALGITKTIMQYLGTPLKAMIDILNFSAVSGTTELNDSLIFGKNKAFKVMILDELKLKTRSE